MHLACRGISGCRVFGDGSAHPLGKLQRDVRRQIPNVYWIVMYDRMRDLSWRPVEWIDAREQDEESNANGIEITESGPVASRVHFRGSYTKVALHINAASVVCDRGYPEVAQLRQLFSLQKEIRGLDVSMDQVMEMTELKADQQVARPTNCQVGANSDTAEMVFCRPHFGDLRGEIRDVLIFVGVEDAKNVRTLESS